MEFSEFIGFIIIVLALLIPVARRLLEARAKRKDPVAFERARREAQEEELRVQQELRALFGRSEPEPKEESVEMPPPPVAPIRVVEKPLPVKRPYQQRKRPSTGRQLLDQLAHRGDMVVLHELLAPPLSLRDERL